MKVYGTAAANALGTKAEKDFGEIVVHEFSGDRAAVVFPAYVAAWVGPYVNVYRLSDLAAEVRRVSDERALLPANWVP